MRFQMKFPRSTFFPPPIRPVRDLNFHLSVKMFRSDVVECVELSGNYKK